MMKYTKLISRLSSICLIGLTLTCFAEDNSYECTKASDLSEQNLQRAIETADKAFEVHFSGEGMAMARFYNPFTEERSKETGSVWMYTSVIEAVNAILHAIQAQDKLGNAEVFSQDFDRYSKLLENLYNNLDYYLGTFQLVSYTQTKEWSVYGVHRADKIGAAKVAGIENVYDDQMWLIRELIESYRITGNPAYLEKAEYLTEYVLDGWDCTRDETGREEGGITWGPGYVTKHSCSNGPMISPLVWLSEIYSGKNEEVTHRYVDASDKQTRKTEQVKKSEYYLDFARKIYAWQKEKLLRSDGVYDDMMGGCEPPKPQNETINGKTYRKGIVCQDRVGPAISYNSGTMLSGASDLYRISNERAYLKDAKQLADSAFQYFAKPMENLPGYFEYNSRGFGNWFNGVLLRAYVDVYPHIKAVDPYISSFQQNLDYGYAHFSKNSILPTDLLKGWKADTAKNQTEGMFSFAYAAAFAVLSKYEAERSK
ncbi:glycoside hydrolase family 76 protein [Maribellus sediminis]|uniref:glycoside hydrolase family 76 protein n=1 Tax=Maribellus sediminis TaxID=2696285 RepID=UPI0019807993|nr:glycoside hydrolase family 76 protein [Maribellus sediminis]